MLREGDQWSKRETHCLAGTINEQIKEIIWGQAGVAEKDEIEIDKGVEDWTWKTVEANHR